MTPLHTDEGRGEEWATSQIQSAMAILSSDWNEEWEAKRAEREARIRGRVSDWLSHARGCEQRGTEYARDAARFAASHRDHHYYLRLSNEQFAKAKFARLQAEIEEQSL